MKYLLKNLQIIDPTLHINQISDIIIENGIIKKIAENINPSDDVKTIEFEKTICTLGFFDMHVHLREPGYEQAETIKTGSDAAAEGGFTAIACMPNTNPTIDTSEVVESILKKSENHIVNVFPIGAVTKGRKGESLSPIYEMHESGAVGFSDDGVAVKTANMVKLALEYSKLIGTPLIEHCEDESLFGGSINEGTISTELGLPPIPSVAEELTIARDILLAQYTQGKLHIAHISTKNSVDLVRNAKAKGLNVTAEVTPHHFSLTENSLRSYDTNYKMNPPLRTEEDVEAIIEGLIDGTIDVIASDHAPHAQEDKEVEFVQAPNGIIGLETEVGLALSELYNKKKLSIEQIIEKLAINPRQILNIEIPQIKIGNKAEFTFLIPDKIWAVNLSQSKSKSKNSPFDKKLLTGKAIGIFNNSKLYLNGEYV